MTDPVTAPDDPQDALLGRILLRAQWLHGLPPDERERLGEVALREVDRRFADWLDARVAVGDDGGG
jgi:hypothetical protein